MQCTSNQQEKAFFDLVERCVGCNFHLAMPVMNKRTLHACSKPGVQEDYDHRTKSRQIAGVTFYTGEGKVIHTCPCDPNFCGEGR